MTELINWWQHLPEHIDPVLLHLGPIQIRYYGLMYATAFLVFYWLTLYRTSREKTLYSRGVVEDFFIWSIIGVVLGSRLGYVLIYNLDYYLQYPLQIFLPFSLGEKEVVYQGLSGMSYHGGVLGFLVTSYLFCRRHRLRLWEFIDFLVPALPLGYAFGRLGNFLNGELYGRVTDAAWGMYFPFAPTYELRHPSQLYEMMLEGVFLFVLIWPLRHKTEHPGFLSGLYLFGYGAVRFIVEFFRQPDAQIGFVVGQWSMGQVLCLIMVVAGGILMYLSQHLRRADA